MANNKDVRIKSSSNGGKAAATKVDQFSSVSEKDLQALLVEKRTFKPSKEFQKNAHVQSMAAHAKAKKDPEKFWAGFAKELDWFKPWKKTLVWKAPHARWFDGGKLNVSYNCLDRHLDGPRKNKAAIIWEGDDGATAVLTYRDLW